MFGIDISNWQGDLNLQANADRFDFCIIKATEGRNYTDEYFEKFAFQLTKLGKPFGTYHFARPDLRADVADMEREAVDYVNALKSMELIGKGIMVLDWETEPIDAIMWAEAWLNKVVELTGIKPFIYINENTLTRWRGKSIIQNYPIWLASWYNLGNEREVREEYNKLKQMYPQIEIPIWQYTSEGSIEGYNGMVDLDYSPLSTAEWEICASGKMNDKEVIIEDMQWAIDNGLFKGYPDGSFQPRSDITREELATVMKRFYDTFLTSPKQN